MPEPIGSAAPQELPQLDKLTGPERAFMVRLQEAMNRGEVMWWRYQPFSLRLAEGARYTPDYATVERGGLIVLYEVKGTGGFKATNFGRGGTRGDGSRSRLAFLSAVEEYPMYRFRTAFQRRKKDGGGFLVEDHHPGLGMCRGTDVEPEQVDWSPADVLQDLEGEA